jgi:hypothetical protein
MKCPGWLAARKEVRCRAKLVDAASFQLKLLRSREL